MLVTAGADVELAAEDPKVGGLRPLHMAAMAGQSEVRWGRWSTRTRRQPLANHLRFDINATSTPHVTHANVWPVHDWISLLVQCVACFVMGLRTRS